MKCSSVTFEYYMKNGAVLKDDSIQFDPPMSIDNPEFMVYMAELKLKIKNAIIDRSQPCLAIGHMYIDGRELQAVKYSYNYT